MIPALLGRVAVAALALVFCAAPVGAQAQSGAPKQPGPPSRPMVADPASVPDFHLQWVPDPLAPDINSFPYPRLTPDQLISHPSYLDRQARRNCPEANNLPTPTNPTGGGALRNVVPAVTWYCWQHPDDTSPNWTPQGISGSEDARAGGTVNNHHVFVASWYGHDTGSRTPTRSRVSFLVAGTGRYVNVELVQLVPGPVRFTGLPTHAGGIVWHGNYLYVADTNEGLRVFDTRKILDLGRTNDPRAPGHRFVLPEVGLWYTGSTQHCNWATRACYDYVTLDRSAASWQFITGEYCQAAAGAWCNSRLARWRRDDIDITSQTPVGRTIHAQAVYQQPVTSVQGGVSYRDPANTNRTCYYFDSSRGERNLGWLVTDRPNRTPVPERGGVGLQDLYVQRSNHRLWTVTEWPGNGKRILYSVRQPSCP